MYLRATCILALVSVVSMELMLQTKLTSHWDKFKAKHKKSYTPEEESMKKENFKKNVETVMEHNLKADLGDAKFKLAVNEYSDMSSEEFRTKMCGLKMPARSVNRTRLGSGSRTPLGNLPQAVDWRSRGIVTPIKNQGNCGSCWSFAVAGALEGAWAKNRGQLVTLSEQNLVDCASQSAGYSNMGCDGGFPDSAFQYIIDNGGLDRASCYPYQMQQGYCHYDPSCVGATMSRYVDIMQGDEEEMMEAVATYGPVSVGLDAQQPDFQSYSYGVYSSYNCQQQGNHAVLVVGYGNEGGEDYWLIKNSWGTSWGEQGYMKLARNSNNMCGVTNMASYPII